MDLSKATLERLIKEGDATCACGQAHATELSFLRIGMNATQTVPQALEAIGVTRPFIVFDSNTHRVAWPVLEPVLRQANIRYTTYILPGEHIEPDEYTMGSLCMAFDRSCDVVMAVGSGVINDCCKVLANVAGLPSVVLATAPSMDGYASDSSSMIQSRVKVSLYNACPAAIIADTAIIKDAPERMLWAGLGDMLAKYISICEWRIAHIVTGEYYCENIAGLVRASLRKVVANAQGLAARDPDAVEAVIEGLILSGIAMSYAKSSRPASGLEHYFSHIWEMMALDKGTATELHGIQVGVGTYLTLKLYKQIRTIVPCREKALQFVGNFDNGAWERQTRDIFGKAADTIIEKEKTTYKKNDPIHHAKRIDRIIAHWDEIQRIIAEELPPIDDILALMRRLGMPVTPRDLSISQENVLKALIGSRDIRNKYLTSSLLWDLGLLYGVEVPS